MPELPEVETVVASLAPLVTNCVFTDVELLRDSALHPASLPLHSLKNRRISTLSRRGKLLHFELEASDSQKLKYLSLIIHLRMTGRIFTECANSSLGKHTRCVFTLQKPDSSFLHLYFDDARTFGKILVATPEILSAWPFWKNMGPEPFSINPEDFKKRLSGARPVKTVLLDQESIAGIGNIYADESLFAAGIHPTRAAGKINAEEAGTLLEAIKSVLSEAIAKKGSSIRDYRDASGEQGQFQKFFSVYGRAGEPCKKCGKSLEKTRIGGRTTVFCPTCQK